MTQNLKRTSFGGVVSMGGGFRCGFRYVFVCKHITTKQIQREKQRHKQRHMTQVTQTTHETHPPLKESYRVGGFMFRCVCCFVVSFANTWNKWRKWRHMKHQRTLKEPLRTFFVKGFVDVCHVSFVSLLLWGFTNIITQNQRSKLHIDIHIDVSDTNDETSTQKKERNTTT